MIGNSRSPYLFPLAALRPHAGSFLGVGPFFPAMNPQPPAQFVIAGVSRDSTGAPLAYCTCTLFRTNMTGPTPVYTQVDSTLSNSLGEFHFYGVGSDTVYRITFDKDGSPALAGITLRNLAGETVDITPTPPFGFSLDFSSDFS